MDKTKREDVAERLEGVMDDVIAIGLKVDKMDASYLCDKYGDPFHRYSSVRVNEDGSLNESDAVDEGEYRVEVEKMLDENIGTMEGIVTSVLNALGDADIDDAG